MYKLTPPPSTFVADARFTVPGQAEPALIKVEWRYKSKDDLQAWIRTRDGVDHLESLAEVIAGWSEICDADDQPLPFSRQALAVLLNSYPAAGRDLVGAYIGALFDSRLGN
jgi:hypothetical protein